jgi:hypothetical protein
MNSPSYRFGPLTRRVLIRVVDALRPRWPDFDPPITEAVAAKIERDVGGFPLRVRVLVQAALWLLELGGALYGCAPWPLAFSSRASIARRFEAYERARSPALRGAFILWRTHVLLVSYGMPEVERHLRIDREGWRASRRALRAKLLLSHPPTVRTPDPLVAGGDPVAQNYLTFEPHSFPEQRTKPVVQS